MSKQSTSKVCLIFLTSRRFDTMNAWLQFGVFDRLDKGSGSYRWWNEGELKEICARMGLDAYKCERRLRFILFSVTKPESA